MKNNKQLHSQSDNKSVNIKYTNIIQYKQTQLKQKTTLTLKKPKKLPVMIEIFSYSCFNVCDKRCDIKILGFKLKK